MRRTLLAFLAVLLLAGCAGLNRTGEDESEAPEAIETIAAASTFAPDMSTAARIIARGELVVGVRYDLEPFSFIASQDGDLAGLEIDLARELARRWLGDPEAVHFIQVRSDTAMSHIQNGDIDIALAGVIHTQQGEINGDFGPAYFLNGQALLVYPESGIQSVNDLQGRNVGLVTWTRSGSVLAATTTVSPTYLDFTNYFEVVEALRTRQVDVYADQRHRLERARRTVVGTGIVGQYTQEPFALLFRSNDPAFANLVTLTFQDLETDGTLAKLYGNWLPGTPRPPFFKLSGPAPTPTLAQLPKTLSTLNVGERIRQRGKVAVGYIQGLWPYSGDRDDGVQTGFEVRLAARLAERWLGSREAVQFVPVTRDTGYAKLESGEVDLLVGGWTRSRDGELQNDYSIAVYDDGVSLLSSAAAPVQAIADLAGQPIGVIAGSAGEAAVPELSQSSGVGLSPIAFPDIASAVAAIQSGQIRAVLAERALLLDTFYNVPGLALSDTRFTYRPVCFVLPQGDSAYRDLVNLTLMWLQADGSYSELYGTWFDDAIPQLESWPGNPAAPLTLQATQ